MMTPPLHYRYRTEALAGPWRESAAMARDDAIRAHQARAREGVSFEWLVRGWVEDRAAPPMGLAAG
jgi:hypothetical protein